MKRTRLIILSVLATLVTLLPLWPAVTLAAGISVSGGGNYAVGQTLTVTVVATGTTFNAFHGTISMTGSAASVSTVSYDPSVLWVSTPGVGKTFDGALAGKTATSFTVATIKLKATKVGSGSIGVSDVVLVNGSNGSVGTSGGSTSFTIGRAPTPPGGVAVSSTTHPDQSQSYEATTVVLNWTAPTNGATGYSYVFDTADGTTPPTTVTSTATTITYDNVAIGNHFFHIRALNGDGWGATTEFAVNVKEPAAKVDSTLGAPTITTVAKTANFQTDLNKGTVSGVTISGTGGLADYTMNLSFDPKDRLPAELFAPVATATSTDKTDAGVGATDGATTPPAVTPATTTALTPLQTTPNADGSWSISFNYPIPSGFYTLTAQSQEDKVLSPASAPVYLEVSVAGGGSVKFITATDQYAKSSAVKVLGINFKSPTQLWAIIAGIVVLLLALAAGGFYWWVRRGFGQKI
ncbi:MAG TPA: hypothetical protein VMQ44_03625 [Candidatus Saccharimonadales bacterium]|nr:hypothetical protein [Candidatus Saccharimonadales bacterium]